MKSRRKILIIDDEQPTVDSLEILLSDQFDLLIARSGEEALESLRSQTVDFIFLDITLPGIDGFETLKEIKKIDDSMEVVMLTADDKARTAMRSMELGAFHYITKPYDKDDILLVTQRILEKKMMSEEILSLRDDVEELDSFHSMIGQDARMRELYQIITKVASTDSRVLIMGESGTGKELVAKAIHEQSPRKDQHFKAINCGAIPENLLESEFFGHEKGAFTGATERKIGKFELADEGTLFLDEISAMSEPLQVKLLRVLQEQEIERVGGTKSIPINVRILAASNADLRKLVEKGRFREDLYFRLSVIPLYVPALRERVADIPVLADHFIQFFAKKFHKNVRGITAEAQRMLQNYAWPGNVRELKNVVERAVVLCDGPVIGNENFPLELTIPLKPILSFDHGFSLKLVMDNYEREIVLNVLRRADWNQSRAAEILGIHRNTLLAKMEGLNINVRQLKEQEGRQVLV